MDRIGMGHWSRDMNEAVPLIDSRESFTAALQWGFETAIERGARCITCADPGFEE